MESNDLLSGKEGADRNRERERERENTAQHTVQQHTTPTQLETHNTSIDEMYNSINHKKTNK